MGKEHHLLNLPLFPDYEAIKIGEEDLNFYKEFYLPPRSKQNSVTPAKPDPVPKI